MLSITNIVFDWRHVFAGSVIFWGFSLLIMCTL